MGIDIESRIWPSDDMIFFHRETLASIHLISFRVSDAFWAFSVKGVALEHVPGDLIPLQIHDRARGLDLRQPSPVTPQTRSPIPAHAPNK